MIVDISDTLKLLEVGSNINPSVFTTPLPNGCITIALSFPVLFFNCSNVLSALIPSVFVTLMFGLGSSLGSSKPLISMSYACARLHF